MGDIVMGKKKTQYWTIHLSEIIFPNFNSDLIQFNSKNNYRAHNYR